jgi:hypothetical protein
MSLKSGCAQDRDEKYQERINSSTVSNKVVVKNIRSKTKIKQLDVFLIKFSKSVFIETHSYVLDLLDAHRWTVRRTEIFQ